MPSDETGRLARFRDTLQRSSTANRVADTLREHIIEGGLAPGDRISEGAYAPALGVSRNTLREAFRLLSHERLVVQAFNRGVSVAVPSVDDVIDLYLTRRPLEVAAVRGATGATADAIAPVGAAVDEGEKAMDNSDWMGVGTANMHFHQAIAGLAGSPRTNVIIRRLLAELRLVFHIMASPEEFHAPYLERNRDIHRLLGNGDADTAAERLDTYLDIARDQLVTAYQARRASEEGASR